MSELAEKILQVPYDYSNSHETLTFSENEFSKISAILDETNIEYRNSGSNHIIDIKNLPFRYFHNIEEFSAKIKFDNFDLKNEIVVKLHTSLAFLDPVKAKVVSNDIEALEKNSLENSLEYVQFVRFLVDKSKSENEAYNLVDYYDNFNEELAFISSNSSARLKIPITNHIPFTKLRKGKLSVIDKLDSSLSQNTRVFQLFLKAQIFKELERVPVMDRFTSLFLKIEELCNKAQVDYDLYVSELSIDEVKERYQLFRSKFFSETSDILKSTSSYIIGLPITTLGGAYAVYNVKDSLPVLLLICLSLFAATGIVLYILFHFNEDLISIHETAGSDYNLLISHKFFDKQPDEKKIFESMNERLSTKVLNTHRIIKAEFWTIGLIISGLIVFTLSVQSIFYVGDDFSLFIFIVLILIVGIISNQLHNPTLKKTS